VSGFETVGTLYYAYFQSMLVCGLIFWGNSANAKLIFRLQSRAMIQIPKTTSCKQYFKSLHILLLPCLHIYIYEILAYIKSISNVFITNSGIHSHNTRRKEDLFIVPCNKSLCKNNFNNIGLWLLNHLPQYMKEIPALNKFKNNLKTCLLEYCFYSIDEFLLLGINPSSHQT
jgi:hypothetical protein